MTHPAFAHVGTFATKTKQGKYPTPELIDIIEDLPTIANYTALHTGRLHLDDNGNIINTEPLPEIDKTDPNYTKLPVRDEFGVSSIPPLENTFRYWALVAENTERHVIRIDFNTDPLTGVDQTAERFALAETPVGQAAKEVATEMKTGNFPEKQRPDAHDDWAYRLFTGLFQDSSSFEEEEGQ